MGVLRRAFGGKPAPPSWPPPGPITSWPAEIHGHLDINASLFEPDGRATIEVVGESHHEGTLERVAEGFDLDGPRHRDHVALLIPEPSNVYDAHAVRVIIAGPVGGHVGYLSRENAVAYRPVIDRLAASGKVAACRASLKGGFMIEDQILVSDGGRVSSANHRASIGVTLYLKTPAGMMAELDDDEAQDS